MNNEYWNEEENFENEDELTRPDKKGNSRNSERKRKWREIETIKEQRRLRRDIAAFEQYSYQTHTGQLLFQLKSPVNQLSHSKYLDILSEPPPANKSSLIESLK